jgi:hypothetical protein
VARADFNIRAGQGRQASYYAGGLVYLADMFERELIKKPIGKKPIGSVETEPMRKFFRPVAGHLGQSAWTQIPFGIQRPDPKDNA